MAAFMPSILSKIQSPKEPMGPATSGFKLTDRWCSNAATLTTRPLTMTAVDGGFIEVTDSQYFDPAPSTGLPAERANGQPPQRPINAALEHRPHLLPQKPRRANLQPLPNHRIDAPQLRKICPILHRLLREPSRLEEPAIRSSKANKIITAMNHSPCPLGYTGDVVPESAAAIGEPAAGPSAAW